MLFLPLVLGALAALDAAPKPTLQPTVLPVPVLLTSVSLVDDTEEQSAGWTGAVTVGASVSSGNTDRTTASATIDAVREFEDKDRITLGFNWNYAEENDIRTQRRTGARAQYDSFLTDKTYWLTQLSAESDEQAGIDLRWTVGAGLGRQVLDSHEWKWSVESGLTYFNEALDNNVDDSYLAARFASRTDWTYSEKTSFGNVLEIFPSLENGDDVYGRSDTRATVNLTESMLGQVQWIWDWDNTPATGRKRSDHLLLLTVGWAF